jgi:hypothetical protein
MSALRSLATLRKERPRFVAVSVALLLLLLAYPFVDVYLRGLRASGVPGYDWVPPFHFNDFGSYATAIARWSEGKSIYWRNSSGGFFATYLYPPVYVLFFLPWFEVGLIPELTALPLGDTSADVSALLMEAFSLGLLWVGLQLVARESGLRLTWYDRVVALWALVGFQPLLFSMKLGQVSALIGAAFCFAFVSMERNDTAGHLASGMLTTFGSGIKLYYATSGAHLLRNRDRFLGAVAGGVGLVALSLAVFGVDNNVAYLEVLAWGKGWGASPLALYLWHPGYFKPFYAIASSWPLLAAGIRIGLVLGVAALAVLAREADVRRETFALGLAVYPLAAPVAYTQDFVALLVVAAILVAVEFERPDGRPWIPVLAVGLLDVHAYLLRWLVLGLYEVEPFGSTVVALAQPGLWGTVLLAGLAAYRVAGAVDPVSIP